MTWDSAVPEGRRNEAGEWLCLMCDEPGTFSAEVDCGGCGLATHHKAAAAAAEKSLARARAAESAALERVRARLLMKKPPAPTDQERVARTRVEARIAERDLGRARVYAAALAAPHKHPVHACDKHRGA